MVGISLFRRQSSHNLFGSFRRLLPIHVIREYNHAAAGFGRLDHDGQLGRALFAMQDRGFSDEVAVNLRPSSDSQLIAERFRQRRVAGGTRELQLFDERFVLNIRSIFGPR